MAHSDSECEEVENKLNFSVRDTVLRKSYIPRKCFRLMNFGSRKVTPLAIAVLIVVIATTSLLSVFAPQPSQSITAALTTTKTTKITTTTTKTTTNTTTITTGGTSVTITSTQTVTSGVTTTTSTTATVTITGSSSCPTTGLIPTSCYALVHLEQSVACSSATCKGVDVTVESNVAPSYMEHLEIWNTLLPSANWVCTNYSLPGTAPACSVVAGSNFVVVPSGVDYGEFVSAAVAAKPSLGLVDPLGVTAIPLSSTGCSGACMAFEATIIGSSGAFLNGSTATVEATVVAPVGATVTINVVEIG